MPPTWITLVFGGTAAMFFGVTVHGLHHLKWARRLPSLRELDAAFAVEANRLPTRCSVVIAARDEKARIEATVTRLLAQRDVEIDVIVADDRSTDGTGEILQRLAVEDRRVQALRIDALPPGWLGKCHACHVGASAATAEWILFTDADCWLKPDTLVRALRVADRERVDHIALTPGVVAAGLGARAWHLAFLLSLANWFSGVNRDRPGAYLGMGAFNLVRAEAYRQCGGYEALRMTVVDDIKLGLLLHRAGKRTRAFIGGDDAECHWGTTVRTMFKIMEKNYFAAVDYRLGAVVAGAMLGIPLFAVVVAGPITGRLTGATATIAWLSTMLPAAVIARRVGWPLRSALAVPCMFPILLCAVVNSTWVTLRQGGIRWRDTFYPLDELRRGNVQ